MNTDEIRAALFPLIEEALAATDQEPLGDVDESQDLFLPDVLDSVALATLIVLIEEEYDIEIDDEEIDPEQFQTLASIAQLIETKIRD